MTTRIKIVKDETGRTRIFETANGSEVDGVWQYHVSEVAGMGPSLQLNLGRFELDLSLNVKDLKVENLAETLPDPVES
jgi:hypothetical protein